MTIAIIGNIMERIKHAPIESKIAVFIVTIDQKRYLDAVFDSAVETKKRKAMGYFDYVGSYSAYDDLKEVRQTLIEALRG